MWTRATVSCLLLLVALAGAQEGEEPARPRRARPHAAARAAATPAARDESASFLHQLADAQRSLGEQMQQLKAELEGLHGELATRQDEEDSLAEEVKALRDEVKGLYVESSTLKQQIDALKDDVAAVNSNVSGFRTFSGFFLAAVILMGFVTLVLSIRR